MPGISFLFKKGFHPMRTDNQKRLFVAEEKAKTLQDRERELAEQVLKERELLAYEQLGQAPDRRDPRGTELKFMYSAPSKAKGTKEQQQKDAVALFEPPKPIPLDANGDDPAVRAFRMKLMGLGNKSSSEQGGGQGQGGAQSQEQQGGGDKEDDDEDDKQAREVLIPQSALEKAVGKRSSKLITFEEQVERHPFLKNAPMEGDYAKTSKNLQLKHKPFNEVIRNVRCLRCQQWGHQSGDRECSMNGIIHPLDHERLIREDPMSYHREKEREREREMNAVSRRENGRGGVQLVNGEGESDPEGEFLKTLTRREKKLLLRKLEQLEGIEPSTMTSSSREKEKERKREREKRRKEKAKEKKREKEREKQKEKRRKKEKEREKEKERKRKRENDREISERNGKNKAKRQRTEEKDRVSESEGSVDSRSRRKYRADSVDSRASSSSSSSTSSVSSFSSSVSSSSSSRTYSSSSVASSASSLSSLSYKERRRQSDNNKHHSEEDSPSRRKRDANSRSRNGFDKEDRRSSCIKT